jgi:hypothetical protein
MDIKLRIIRFTPDQHGVIAQYFTDTHEMPPVHMEIRVVPAPSGQALIEYLAAAWPPNRAWFELQAQIAAPDIDTSLAHVKDMAGKEYVVPPAPAVGVDSALRQNTTKVKSV